MLYGEIIAVCSEMRTKHINILCGQKIELLNVKLVVHIVTAGLKGLKQSIEYLFLGLYLEMLPVTEDGCWCFVIFNQPGS
jgi:hypothetical protein